MPGRETITLAMVTEALQLSGIELAEADKEAMVEAANRNLTRYKEMREVHIPNDVSPPFHFSPIVPGLKVDKTAKPFTISKVKVKRPANLEEVAFWPVRHLAELIRTKQVSSVELTRMYLTRLHRYNATLNNVVTFLDDHGLAEAAKADAEIAKGNYKGPLHGIPWGAKDIISVKGFKTTWGAAVFKEQVFDYDASVVEMLREAGAVLIAKVSTGELAGGDNWFGGQTKSPWDPTQGSSGSSAGPSSATAAGCVGFAIGSETSGSILSPSARCGLAGLRPTFGRISRYGVMALSWTQDRLGPICRYAEDCALVMQAIAKPDGRDMSVMDLPFNWNAEFDIKTLRVGIVQESFDELTNASAKANAAKTLETLKAIGVKEFVPVPRARRHRQPQRHRRGVGGVLRRARPRRPHEGHAQRAADRPPGAGGGLPAGAAHADDDDDGAGQGHLARGRLHRRVQQHWRRWPGRTRWTRPRRAGRRSAPARSPADADPAPLEHGQPGLLPGGQPAERLRRHRHADQRHHLRAAVPRDGDPGPGQGLPGRREVALDEAGEDGDHVGTVQCSSLDLFVVAFLLLAGTALIWLSSADAL